MEHKQQLQHGAPIYATFQKKGWTRIFFIQIWRQIPAHPPSFVQAFGFNGSLFSVNRMDTHNGDNERYNTAQLAEGKRSTGADTSRGTEVKRAFLQENEMA